MPRWLWRGDGAGGWIGSAQIGSATAGTHLLGPGDWDGDGRNDLLTGDTAGRLWLCKGNGAGMLGVPKQIGNGWTSLNTVMPVGDINGDLHADIVGRTAARVLLLYPENGRRGSGTRLKIGNGWASFTAVLSIGDATRDNRADILARTSAWGHQGVRRQQQGELVPGSSYTGGWTSVKFAS